MSNIQVDKINTLATIKNKRLPRHTRNILLQFEHAILTAENERQLFSIKQHMEVVWRMRESAKRTNQLVHKFNQDSIHKKGLGGCAGGYLIDYQWNRPKLVIRR